MYVRLQILHQPDFQQRFQGALAPKVLATFHPSYRLRIPDPEERARQRLTFDQDIALAYRLSLEA